MSHYVGYNIRGHVYTAPQMMALRRLISGHQIGVSSSQTSVRPHYLSPMSWWTTSESW